VKSGQYGANTCKILFRGSHFPLIPYLHWKFHFNISPITYDGIETKSILDDWLYMHKKSY
jgi:hypothetical protein